jgi:hypothetical protein
MSEARGAPGLGFRVRRRLGGEIDAVLDGLLGRVRSYPNELCLRVFALRRSGHHAILNWIRHQLPFRHWLLNDCRLGENPFEGAVLSSSVIRGRWHEHRVFHLGRETRGRHASKGALIYNFEESDLRDVPRLMPIEREGQWLGPSRQRQDILMLRDPFNLLASKLKWAYGDVDRPSKPSFTEVEAARELWKVHAREFLGETSFLSDLVPISYNAWFLDRDYRDAKAAELGFENRDVGLATVARWGPTMSEDSFDGLRYDGRAQEMKVLERWKRFENDAFYRDLLSDPEIHELSERIFGPLPGTDALL